MNHLVLSEKDVSSTIMFCGQHSIFMLLEAAETGDGDRTEGEVVFMGESREVRPQTQGTILSSCTLKR